MSSQTVVPKTNRISPRKPFITANFQTHRHVFPRWFCSGRVWNQKKIQNDVDKNNSDSGKISADDTKYSKNGGSSAEDEKEKLSLGKRFKKMYKEHGKWLVIVHCTTYCMWFGSFYTAVYFGFDIIPWLQWVGASETVIQWFQNPTLGTMAIAYLMCKVVSPARYFVTISGTMYVVRLRRRLGYIPPVTKETRLRTFAKDGGRIIRAKSKKQTAIWKEKTKKREAHFKAIASAKTVRLRQNITRRTKAVMYKAREKRKYLREKRKVYGRKIKAKREMFKRK